MPSSVVSNAGGSPLEGVSVLDLSTGIAGGYCTKVLADGGASVVKAEPPEGDALRRWSASGAPLGDDDGPLFQYLAGSKQSVVADPTVPADVALVRSLAGAADVIVWSHGSALTAHVDLAPRRLVAQAPHASVVTITPFGLDGPWAGAPATEATLQAWSGGPGQRGLLDRAPLMVGGRMGDWVTGMVAATAALISHHRSCRIGFGELVDVSMLEALCLTQVMYPVTFESIAGQPLRPHRLVNLPGIHATADGFVGFMVVTGQQWLDFCAMVQRPDWLDDESLLRFDNRNQRRAELVGHVDAWMARRSTDEVVDLASAFRLPVAAVGNGESIPGFDHLGSRGFYVKNPRRGFLQPDVPYTLHGATERHAPTPAPRLGEHTPRIRSEPRQPKTVARDGGRPGRLPFEGLRVADITNSWAGPCAGHLLGMLGADVIHVESPKRPDPMRFNTIRAIGDDQWWEWTPLFHGTNTSKRDVTIDLNDPRGRDLLRQLLARCDVLLENYSPRVMDNWGLTWEAVHQIRPDLVYVRMPAFGLEGPWRDRVGYAQTMEQVSGLAWMTGWPDLTPEIPNGPCDPIAGTHAVIALLLALEHRRRTGDGMLVEVPMVGGALNLAAEIVIEHSANGALIGRDGNRSPWAAPQGTYLTADVLPDGRQDRWVTIAVETDEQWAGLRHALGDPGWAADPSLATHDGRRAAHDAIDTELASWCLPRSSDEIIEQLWAAGVPAGKVLLPHEQYDIPQLHARGWFADVDHPVTGTNRHGGWPARFGNGPDTWHRRPVPLLGEHNREVFGGLLGVDDDVLAALEADGVIGVGLASEATAW